MDIYAFINSSVALSSVVAISGAITATSLLNMQPAVAGFWDRVPVPTGMYLEIRGKKFYLGDYSANPGLAYPGSKWEIKVNGRIWAHGYGETPGWVIDLAKRFFRGI